VASSPEPVRTVGTGPRAGLEVAKVPEIDTSVTAVGQSAVPHTASGSML